MSPWRQLQYFDMAIPPYENVRSLDTDNDMTAR